MKKIRYIIGIMLLGAILAGCGNSGSSNESPADNTAGTSTELKQESTGKEDTQNVNGIGTDTQNTNEEDTDAENEGEDMEYIKQNAEMIAAAISCEQSDAEVIATAMGRQNIKEVVSALNLNTSDGYAVQVETQDGKVYIVYIDKKYHMYAVQADSQNGEYIYREIE